MRNMSFWRRIGCRIVHSALLLAAPFLPYRAPRVLHGAEEAAEAMAAQGLRKALLVTGRRVRANGLTDPVCRALEGFGIGCEIFDGTCPNPTVENVEAAFARYREAHCDCVVAVGGGSPIDCAKGVCAKATDPKREILSFRGLFRVRRRPPLLLAVPTTAGSGSEASVAAVLTDGAARRKFTVISFRLTPRLALLDPALTRTLPPAQTAESGMDALTHAVEAYIGRATTAETRRAAEDAVRLIGENLERAYRDGGDLAARGNMQLAAYEAGLAFTVSYVGYVHALAHALGGAYDLPHGRTNATLLPVVLRRYGKACEGKLARLARASGWCDDPQDAPCAARFIEKIEAMNRAMGLPAAIAIPEEDLPRLAAAADREANPLYPVPLPMDARALEEILRLVRATPAPLS